MTKTQDIVARLWNLCHVLRDDGVTYHEYVTELTFLLFLKMTQEIGVDEKQLPEGYRWRDLEAREGTAQLDFYKKLLIHLGTHGSPRVQAIFANAQTCISKPKNLKNLVAAIDELDWYSAKEEGLGDMYEGLLEKNAAEQKSGAGQYFTPRPLIESHGPPDAAAGGRDHPGPRRRNRRLSRSPPTARSRKPPTTCST